MKLKLIYESIVSSENIKNKFGSINTDDIIFNSKNNHGQMELKVVFKDNTLNNIYRKLMLSDYDEPETIIDLEIQNMNHIHINAIPNSLMGIGLGKNIYRKVLEEYDYISTGFVNARSSEDAQRVWRSLINSDDYFYFISVDEVRVTLANKDAHPLIYEGILTYFGNYLEKTNFDKTLIDDYDDY